MDFLLETAISAFFLVGILAIAFLFFWRARAVERQIGLLMKAALTNTKDIRNCTEAIHGGFHSLSKADSHQRVLLASLNSQISNLGSMLEAGYRQPERSVAFAPVDPGVGESAKLPSPTHNTAKPFEVVGGSEASLPGYRSIRNRTSERPVVTSAEKVGLQRKIRTIEDLFRKVELPRANGVKADASGEAGGAPESNVAPLRPGSPPSFADLVSQRRRVAHG